MVSCSYRGQSVDLLEEKVGVVEALQQVVNATSSVDVLKVAAEDRQGSCVQSIRALVELLGCGVKSFIIQPVVGSIQFSHKLLTFSL